MSHGSTNLYQTFQTDKYRLELTETSTDIFPWCLLRECINVYYLPWEGESGEKRAPGEEFDEGGKRRFSVGQGETERFFLTTKRVSQEKSEHKEKKPTKAGDREGLRSGKEATERFFLTRRLSEAEPTQDGLN